jgi:hypothetical protein
MYSDPTAIMRATWPVLGLVLLTQPAHLFSQLGSGEPAAYDLKKLRGKQIVCRLGKTTRYETIPQGARAMAALLVLRDKAIKPLLAAAQQHRRSRRPQNPSPLDLHYQTIRASMRGVFHELRIAV